jgi:N-acyl homoserine lactone hydrolase
MRSLELKHATLFAVVLLAGLPFEESSGAAMAGSDVELWRLDCGEVIDVDLGQSSDTFAYDGRRLTFANSCYLIRHNQEYMLWDTGFSRTASWESTGWAIAKGESLVAQLSHIHIKPEQISVIGISHGHPDHTGQAIYFPQARLLIGKADFEIIASENSDKDKLADLSPWLTENAKVELIPDDALLTGDRDVFGDGSVIMLAAPGHTLGHPFLLVRMPKTGPIILSGDLWSFAEQMKSNTMEMFNVDRAKTLASMDRVLKIAANLKATIIIQHDRLDINKLPLFPSSAR